MHESIPKLIKTPSRLWSLAYQNKIISFLSKILPKYFLQNVDLYRSLYLNRIKLFIAHEVWPMKTKLLAKNILPKQSASKISSLYVNRIKLHKFNALYAGQTLFSAYFRLQILSTKIRLIHKSIRQFYYFKIMIFYAFSTVQ